MSKKNRDQHSSHFISGVAVGSILTALVTTKMGRRLVKELTHHGVDLVEGRIDLDRIVDKVKTAEDEDEGEVTPRLKRKRVFRGVKKK